MDFLVSVAAARVVAGRLGGALLLPDPEHVASPNAGLVRFEQGGRCFVVDILSSLAGLDAGQVRADASELPMPSGGSLRLLNPLDVLRARVARLAILRRSGSIAVNQLRAAPLLLEAEIAELLASGRSSLAQDRARGLVALAGSPGGDHVLRAHGIDVFAAAAALADLPGWNPRFAEHQIRRAVDAGIARRDRRLAEQARRARRDGS